MTPHGTYSRYTHGRCRCDLCKAANRRRADAKKRAVQDQPLPPEPDYRLPVAPDVDTTWMEQAACKGRSDLFFPAPGSGNSNQRFHDAAATICHSCPVQDNCRHYAIAIGAQHGVWAGVPARQLQAS